MLAFFRARIKIACPRCSTGNTFYGELHGRVDSFSGRARWIPKISARAASGAISTSTWKPRRIAECSANFLSLCFVQTVGQDLQWSADVIKEQNCVIFRRYAQWYVLMSKSRPGEEEGWDVLQIVTSWRSPGVLGVACGAILQYILKKELASSISE